MKYSKIFWLIFCCLNTLCAFSQNRFSDVNFQKIYQFQDTRNSKALVPYLYHKNAFYRYAATMAFASIQDSSMAIHLLKKLAVEKFAEIRMAAAFSLGQLHNPKYANHLMIAYSKEKNHQVQAMLIEAIGKCANHNTATFYKTLINDSNYQRLPLLRGLLYAKRAKILDAALKQFVLDLHPKLNNEEEKLLCEQIIGYKNVVDEMEPIALYNLTNLQILDSLKLIANPYQQIDFIKKCYIPNGYMVDFVINADLPTPLRTYCAEEYLKDTMSEIFLERLLIGYLESGDIAYISLACNKIMNDSIFYTNKAKILPALNATKQKLSIPRDYEAYVDLEKTLAFLNNKKYSYKAPKFNHPIDWKHVKSINSEQRVKIITSKGEIVIQCAVNEAPATVSNFIKLVDSGYYDGKFIHRMVPHFVVQGGCPRGDGWGALSWSQRSEFSYFTNYQPGSVGIASVGKDSEGVQFFITHTYTPHLNGRYTQFAKVIEGMDVVNKLQVGDQIIKIIRL